MGTENDFVGLAEAVRQVRAELEDARLEGEGHNLRFGVEQVTLDFTVQVRRAANGKAGVRIGVLTLEGGGTVSRDVTHQIQISLRPEGLGGGPYRVGR